MVMMHHTTVATTGNSDRSIDSSTTSVLKNLVIKCAHSQDHYRSNNHQVLQVDEDKGEEDMSIDETQQKTDIRPNAMSHRKKKFTKKEDSISFTVRTMFTSQATLIPQSPRENHSYFTKKLPENKVLSSKTRSRKPCLLGESRIVVSDISDDSFEMRDSLDRCSLHDKPQHQLYIQSTEQQQQTGRKHVTFSSVQIRRYPMILGDNPYCSMGPPISLGWEYDTMPDMDVLQYDRLRKDQRRTNIAHLVLSSIQRNELLDRIGVSIEERQVVEKEMSQVQRQRTMDCVWKDLTSPLETVVDSARNVRRVFKRQNARLDDDCDNDDGSCSTSSSQSPVETRPRKSKRFTLRRQNAF